MSNAEFDGLPAAVRQQAERAEQQLDQIRRTQQAGAADTPPETVPPATPAEGEQPPEPALDEGTPQTTPPAEPPAQPAVQPVREDWKQKFITLQGKYDAEVPRMAAEIRHLRQLNDNFMQQLSERRETPADVDTPPAAPANDQRRFTTTDEVNEFGKDLVDLQERAIARGVGTVQSELNATKSAVAEMVKRMFYVDLESAIPKYREINADPRFKEFLNIREELVDGQPTLNEILQDAQRTRNSRVAIAVFTRFLDSLPVETTPPAEQPATPAQTPTRDSLAQPPKQRGQVPTREVKVWKYSEYKKFASDLSRGLYDSKPQEAARIQKEIDMAIKEGRMITDS